LNLKARAGKLARAFWCLLNYRYPMVGLLAVMLDQQMLLRH
jgi:hypothetical protein